MNYKTPLTIFRVSATYAGTIIGAGFASGQELLQFFIVYGSSGLAGILLAGFLFIFLGNRILELGFRLKATGYHQLLYYLCGKKAGLTLDMIVVIFLFCVLTIMLAGAGTMCRDFFGLPYRFGLLITAIALTATALSGINGVTAANMLITPLLAIAMLIVGINCLSYHGLDASLFSIPAHPAAQPVPWWPLASLLYVSYNLIMGAAILAPLGATIPQRKIRLLGSLFGGIALALLATLLTVTMMFHYNQVLADEIPMLCISAMQHDFNRLIYALMFVAAMYTTALTNLYGCATKLHSSSKLSIPVCLSLIMTGSLLFSHFGFADLIAALYPAFGFVSLYFTLRLCLVRND